SRRPSSASRTRDGSRSYPRSGRCGCESTDRQWGRSCSYGGPHQLAFERPGISPRFATSRIFTRDNPNLRYTPRERPVMAQRLRVRDALASRGCFCSFTCAFSRSSGEVFELRTLRRVLLHDLGATLLALDHVCLRHSRLDSCYFRKGKLKASSSARP